uniref:Uncharacterized protein n=1 Tax=Opuntia streptacantha TaxID=393608 RepID=A0A7C9CKC1_OPUST
MREREREHYQMKSRTSSSIRAPGQRSIPSTLLFRPIPKCSSVCREGSDAPPSQVPNGGRSPLSLSAFLDRKLHSTSVLPIHKAEKEILSSSLENKHLSESISKDQNRWEGPDEETRPAIEESVFKVFNDKQEVKVVKASSEGIAEQARPDGDVNKHNKNHVVVLGDDPKPKRKAYGLFSHSGKRQRPFYNHYKSGTGWWDSDREGIDEDEVGAKEIWEGMGSATLGGLEWH